MSAVLPLWLGWLMLAFAASKGVITLAWPSWHAMYSAVQPLALRSFTSAPFASSDRASSSSPCRAA